MRSNSCSEYRTNPVWELREFKIGGEPPVNPGQLEEVTVKLTPDLTSNGRNS